MLIAPFILPFILPGLLPVLSPPAPAVVHVVIDTERAYMGAVQKASIEYWLSPDRTWVSQRGRITITRRDLGIRWRIDPAKKTYVEEKLGPPPAPAKPTAGDDIHSARFNYEPVFNWTVTPAGRAMVAGRDSRTFTAEGEADYARTRVGFAIGPRVRLETDPDVNTLIAGLARLDSVTTFLRDAARTRGNGCLMSYEETQEPAIAPTIIQRVTMRLLETVPAPGGIFDVPAGFTKAGAASSEAGPVRGGRS
jgi:hypothetical protein